MSVHGDLSASLVLRRGSLARVGLDRIALIEAVGELGSISGAAKRLGLSYKGAWDGVQALNNLFEAPLIIASVGGRAGGAAVVTERGRAVITAFRQVEREIGAAVSRLEASVAAPGDQDLGALFWTLGLRTSARNALRGTIAAIDEDEVTAKVTLSLGDGVEIVSIITRHSREDLDLTVGAPAIALIKSSFVTLADVASDGGVNRLGGVVTERENGAVASQLRLSLGAGKSLIATVPHDVSAVVGDRVVALIAPANVILAVE